MMQTFAVLADELHVTIAKKKRDSLISPVVTAPCMSLLQKRNVKISSEASGGILAKVCTSKNFLLYSTRSSLNMHNF